MGNAAPVARESAPVQHTLLPDKFLQVPCAHSAEVFCGSRNRLSLDHGSPGGGTFCLVPPESLESSASAAWRKCQVSDNGPRIGTHELLGQRGFGPGRSRPREVSKNYDYPFSFFCLAHLARAALLALALLSSGVSLAALLFPPFEPPIFPNATA